MYWHWHWHCGMTVIRSIALTVVRSIAFGLRLICSPYSTVQHSTAQYSTTQYSTALYILHFLVVVTKVLHFLFVRSQNLLKFFIFSLLFYSKIITAKGKCSLNPAINLSCDNLYCFSLHFTFRFHVA